MDEKNTQGNPNKPKVSIVIPTRNEERFILKCLESIQENTYPHKALEVFIVDGMSQDSTRAIVTAFADDNPDIKINILENPDIRTPFAFNRGIRASTGELVMIMGAHAVYDPDYIEKCVQYLSEYQVDNVGGLRKTVPVSENLISEAITELLSTSFGVGNAVYRVGDSKPKLVDTVFGGCYPREVFERIGLFDEELVRGQDREFNERLRRAGGKILFSPDIICHYFARSNLKDFLRWIYVGGFTPFYISRLKCYRIFSWRNIVPPAFVLFIFAGFLIASLIGILKWAYILGIGFYFVVDLAVSLKISIRKGNVALIATLPWLFFLNHLIYGIGALVGMFYPLRNSKKREVTAKPV